MATAGGSPAAEPEALKHSFSYLVNSIDTAALLPIALSRDSRVTLDRQRTEQLLTLLLANSRHKLCCSRGDYSHPVSDLPRRDCYQSRMVKSLAVASYAGCSTCW